MEEAAISSFKIVLLNLKIMNIKRFEFMGKINTIYYFVAKITFKNYNTKTYNIKISICSKCGDYVESIKSTEEKIFCKCENVLYNKFKLIHCQKFVKVLNQLIYSMYEELECNVDDHSLKPSTYVHEGDCVPDTRTCYSCWRYWCMCCNTGLGGMYGNCTYRKCRIGRKNLGMEY